MQPNRCPWPDALVTRALYSIVPTVKTSRVQLARSLGIHYPDGSRLQRRVKRRIAKADRLSPEHRQMVEQLLVVAHLAHSGT